MNDEEQKSSSFKVNDQRRFDSEGEERTNNPKEVKGDTFSTRPAAETAHDSPGVNFTSFVMSLATQALMQLGQLPPPEGVQIPVDKDAAKETIDILSMLEKKTKNNLDPDEARLLQDVLHSVRLCFLKAK